MSEAAIIAIVILVGVFILMLMTIMKAGVDAAIKMWNGMGAITGVAFGAITVFFFTTELKEQQIKTLETKVAMAEMARDSAISEVAEVSRELQGIPITAQASVWSDWIRDATSGTFQRYEAALERLQAMEDLSGLESLEGTANSRMELAE